MTLQFWKKNVLILLAAVLFASAFGCQDSGQNTPTTIIQPTPTSLPEATVPPALEPQPEIQDPGNPVTYKVSGALSSYMVLQRDNYINVWGWSDDIGGILYGEFMGEKRYAVVEEDGSWLMQFSPHEANREEQVMEIYPLNGKKTTFRRILIGDVYLVSGQSNAEVTMNSCLQVLPEFAEEIKKEDMIRLFLQSTSVAEQDLEGLKTPQKDVILSTWKWLPPVAGNVYNFSAMGYFFAKELIKSTDVPIGLLQCAAGGSVLRELMPKELAESLGHVPRRENIGLGGFYNTLFAPFTNLHVKGMLFYQGESDSYDDFYKTYDRDLAAYVAELRKRFDSNFTFYNVQLSTHGDGYCADMWPTVPQIRNAQWKAVSQIPNSYLVVSMDVGWRDGEYDFWTDWMHPYYKKPIGDRLAHLVAAVEYGVGTAEDCASPLPVNITWEKDSAVISFQYVGSGLTLLEGSELVGFQVTSSDGKVLDVKAEIVEKNKVRVPIGKNTIAIGYGMFFLGYPEYANLCSGGGYPAPAFLLEK